MSEHDEREYTAALTCSTACRAARWKHLEGYGRQRRPERRANEKSKASGLQVSYRKAIEAVEALLESAEVHYGVGNPRTLAEHALQRALSDRQRARLHAREERKKAA